MEDYIKERGSRELITEFEEHQVLPEMDKRGASMERMEEEAYKDKPEDKMGQDNREDFKHKDWKLEKNKKKRARPIIISDCCRD